LKLQNNFISHSILNFSILILHFSIPYQHRLPEQDGRVADRVLSLISVRPESGGEVDASQP